MEQYKKVINTAPNYTTDAIIEENNQLINNDDDRVTI